MTDESFELALADSHNRRVIAKVCNKFKGQVPKEELVYRSHMALFNCLRKHNTRNGNRFTTSLYWHTLNQCKTAVRKKKKKGLLYPLLKSVESPLSVYDKVDIHECIDMLPSGHRQIIVNYFFDGMTLEEIGKQNGYSHVTARQRLNAAKEEFRRLYDGE